MAVVRGVVQNIKTLQNIRRGAVGQLFGVHIKLVVAEFDSFSTRTFGPTNWLLRSMTISHLDLFCDWGRLPMSRRISMKRAAITMRLHRDLPETREALMAHIMRVAFCWIAKSQWPLGYLRRTDENFLFPVYGGLSRGCSASVRLGPGRDLSRDFREESGRGATSSKFNQASWRSKKATTNRSRNSLG